MSLEERSGAGPGRHAPGVPARRGGAEPAGTDPTGTEQSPRHLSPAPGAGPGAGAGAVRFRGDDALSGWLQAAGRGDVGAFDRLYTHTHARVLGLARRVLGDHAQAEEVAQEALFEVWATAARYDPARASGYTWVMVITHRRAVDRYRSTRAAAARDQRASDQDAAAPGYDQVAEEVERNQDRAAVRAALGGLSPLQREAITLAYYAGCSYPEVAARLGVPPGTAKTRIRDGLARLRTDLADQR